MVTQIFWAYFSLTIRFAINKEGRFGLCAEWRMYCRSRRFLRCYLKKSAQSNNKKIKYILLRFVSWFIMKT
jgi:hypothetical protein